MRSEVRIGDKLVGDLRPVYVIAEVGINHNGSLDLAKRMIDGAVLAGADAVKFQKRTPELCVPRDQWLLERDTPWGRMTYIDYRHRIELGATDYAAIDRYCRERGIQWFASCWDEPSVDFMEQFDPPTYKAASASLTDHALLRAMAATGRPLIISTGMSTMDEIAAAVAAVGSRQLLIAHSTSSYPCPVDAINLNMIATLRAKYGEHPIGYSGHEVGLSPTWAAVAMGASFVERHLTLDRAMWGTDQAASVEVSGFMRLVSNIRDIQRALGDGVKRVHDSELASRAKLRRVASSRVVSWTLLAPLIVIGSALVLIACERRWPYDRQRLLRPGFAIDLIGYALIQSAVLAVVIRALVAAIDRATGLSELGLVSQWSFGAQLALFVVTHDFYIYWFHRLQHANRFLWRIHEAHHSARDLDWLAGSRSHALEIAINQTIELGVMVLLGASSDVILAKGAISVASGMWIHANVDLRLGALRWIVNGPEQHRWHHAIDFVPPGRNFATKLALWDWLFGTADVPATRPGGYGLAEGFPRGFLAQQAHAFRAWRAPREPGVATDV